VAAALVLVLGGAGCGDEGGGTTLRVLAAASLTDAFTDLARTFEREHPGVSVSLGFAGSSALVQQIADGAPADVVATADEHTMRALADQRTLAGAPVVVARNRLAIAVEPGNPQRITDLADLGRPGLVVVLCAPEVPCGRLAAAALATAGVTVVPSSLEENVRAVVARVSLGEADAGIVYATDVRAAGSRVEGVAIDVGTEAVYPMAVLAGSRRPSEAKQWLDLVGSDVGQRVLARHGFLPAR
jgi:molybdate transport system substrate-binding protein